MLRFEGIAKTYPGSKALFGVSLDFETGFCYALAGPNGSGKSTLMKIAAGLVKPSAGKVSLDGHAIGPWTKARVAYMSTEPFYYDYMRISTVESFYRDFFRDFDGELFRKMLKYLELEEGMRVKTLSSGMAAKLKLAATLARKADLIMLDEPLNGIDVVGREQVQTCIRKTNREGRTLILSSHLLEDLETLTDKVVLLKKGEVVMTGDLEKIRSESGMSISDLYKSVYAPKEEEVWES